MNRENYFAAAAKHFAQAELALAGADPVMTHMIQGLRNLALGLEQDDRERTESVNAPRLPSPIG